MITMDTIRVAGAGAGVTFALMTGAWAASVRGRNAGFGCEAIADLQLARFSQRSAPRADDVLDKGLWRYSRHPNYFGDAVAWWGIGLIGLAAGPSWSLLGPLGMTFVLLRVTGVAVM